MTGPDEYESVLGLPPGPRPPNHYELLGLELFESSAERDRVRRRWSDRRCRGVGPGLGGANPAGHRQDPLAKSCLLDERAKADYDRQLNHRILGVQPQSVPDSDPDADSSLLSEPSLPAGSSLTAGPSLDADPPQDTVAFEPLPAELIAGVRPSPKA